MAKFCNVKSKNVIFGFVCMMEESIVILDGVEAFAMVRFFELSVELGEATLHLVLE